MYSGADELQRFVSGCDVLVCLLPLTADTEGIIDAELLGWLPKGASVINGARGRIHVESDVLAALDSGQLSYFVTDVTDPEPLPPDSKLWRHPKVRGLGCICATKMSSRMPKCCSRTIYHGRLIVKC